MDIFELLDALEEKIDSGRKLPLTNMVLLDGDKLLDHIDQIRSNLPEEIRQARWVANERERLLAEAKEEAQKILAEAKNQVQLLAEETEVVKKAHERAEEILARAKSVSQEIRHGSEAYADEILSQLENNIMKVLEIVKESRGQLRRNQGQHEQENAS